MVPVGPEARASLAGDLGEDHGLPEAGAALRTPGRRPESLASGFGRRSCRRTYNGPVTRKQHLELTIRISWDTTSYKPRLTDWPEMKEIEEAQGFLNQ